MEKAGMICNFLKEKHKDRRTPDSSCKSIINIPERSGYRHLTRYPTGGYFPHPINEHISSSNIQMKNPDNPGYSPRIGVNEMVEAQNKQPKLDEAENDQEIYSISSFPPLPFTWYHYFLRIYANNIQIGWKSWLGMAEEREIKIRDIVSVVVNRGLFRATLRLIIREKSKNDELPIHNIINEEAFRAKKAIFRLLEYTERKIDTSKIDIKILIQQIFQQANYYT